MLNPADLSPVLLAGWLDLLQPFAVPGPLARQTFTDLQNAYCLPSRHYHTLAHIAHLLQLIETCPTPLSDPAAVRLAAWYHDAVYDPRATDNEERSALLASQVLTRLRLPRATIRQATALIRDTHRHQPSTTAWDNLFFLDADLAILGAAPAAYRRYSAAIRQEYDWVPEDQYRQGRAAVLQKFLLRERLYFTGEMLTRFETQARLNLAAELAELAGN